MARQKRKRPREELVHLLKGQMNALEASSRGFDAGVVGNGRWNG